MSDQLQILFFGQLTDLTGCARTDMPRTSDTHELLQQLYEKYPLLREAKHVVTVNRQIIRQNTPLPASAEIALLPPFSGG